MKPSVGSQLLTQELHSNGFSSALPHHLQAPEGGMDVAVASRGGR